jgi:chromosome segregation ATPase
MKFTTLLFVTMLLSVSLAARMDSLRNAKFAKSKLGKFIVNFAEFTSSLSTPDYNPLFDALDALEANLEDQLAQSQQSHADAEVTHNNLIINYENNRDNANADVVATEQTLNSLAADVVTYENDISVAQQSIADNQQAIVDLNAARAERVAKYEQDVADVSSGIDTIDEALELLRSLQTTSDASAFIQTNDQALAQIKEKLQKSFESLSSKKRTHYRHRPLLMAIVQVMTKQNFVNQEALNKIISLLVDLRAQLVEYSAKLDSDEATAEDNYNVQLQGLNEAVALAEENLSTAQTNLENTNANIASQQEFLAQRTEDYNNAVSSIDSENNLWNQKVQAYNDLVDEINNEIKVVQEAVGVLNAAGIARSE